MENYLSSKEIKKHISDVLLDDYKNADQKAKMINGRFIKVINGYGERLGVFDKMAGVAYRLWNAVKALFGQSDWQLFLKATGSYALDLISNDYSEGELGSVPDSLLKPYVHNYKKLLEDDAIHRVRICLSIIKNKNLKDVKEINELLFEGLNQNHEEIIKKYDPLLKSSENAISDFLRKDSVEESRLSDGKKNEDDFSSLLGFETVLEDMDQKMKSNCNTSIEESENCVHQ